MGFQEMEQTSMTLDSDYMEARRLIASGYCPTSNRYRMLSRLDRPDWLQHMAYLHTKGFPGSDAKNLAEGMRWATGLGGGAADFYRRVHSRDTIEVNEAVFREVKKVHSSNWPGVNDYRDLAE
jgi:hypothetical protein